MRPDLYAELYQVENRHWWHQHKRAVVQQFIDRFANRGKVLDVGSGTGKILEELKEKCWQVRGVDGDKQAILWSKKRGIIVKKVNFDKQKLPFRDGSFNLVLALDVLEHVVSDVWLVKEMKRVLQPGGVMIITVPAYQWLFSYWDRILGHQRRYTTGQMNQLLHSFGLRITLITYFNMLFLPPAVLVREVKGFFRQENQPVSDFKTTPLAPIVIPLLKLYGRIEQWLLRFIKLPFGLSVISVAKKP